MVESGFLENAEEVTGNLPKTCPIQLASKKTSLPGKGNSGGHFGRHEFFCEKLLEIRFPSRQAVSFRILGSRSVATGDALELMAAKMAAASFFANSGKFSVFLAQSQPWLHGGADSHPDRPGQLHCRQRIPPQIDRVSPLTATGFEQ